MNVIGFVRFSIDFQPFSMITESGRGTRPSKLLASFACEGCVRRPPEPRSDRGRTVVGPWSDRETVPKSAPMRHGRAKAPTMSASSPAMSAIAPSTSAKAPTMSAKTLNVSAKLLIMGTKALFVSAKASSMTAKALTISPTISATALTISAKAPSHWCQGTVHDHQDMV